MWTRLPSALDGFSCGEGVACKLERRGWKTDPRPDRPVGSDIANEPRGEVKEPWGRTSPAPALPSYIWDTRRTLPHLGSGSPSRGAIDSRKAGVLAKLTLCARRMKDALGCESSVEATPTGELSPVMGGISIASPTNITPMQHAKMQPCHHLEGQRQRNRRLWTLLARVAQAMAGCPMAPCLNLGVPNRLEFLGAPKVGTGADSRHC